MSSSCAGAGASSKTEDGDEQAPWEADEQERERKEEKRRRAEAAAERSRREEEKKRIKEVLYPNDYEWSTKGRIALAMPPARICVELWPEVAPLAVENALEEVRLACKCDLGRLQGLATEKLGVDAGAYGFTSLQ